MILPTILLAIAGPAFVAASCDSASILFLVDSSASIEARGWPKLVDFVKGLSEKLPTSSRVGFAKFATEVSGQKWIGPKWTIEDFKNAVPNTYDQGVTDTPAALKEAKKMFEGDTNQKKIAVLITDGIPYTLEYIEAREALNATKIAANDLKKQGVTLKLFVFGEENGIRTDNLKELKKFVSKPESDFLYFFGDAGKLGEAQQTKLVDLVCNKE